MSERLTRNAIRCKACEDVIESTHRHDFKYCKCGKVFVDGGLEYCRYGYPWRQRGGLDREPNRI